MNDAAIAVLVTAAVSFGTTTILIWRLLPVLRRVLMDVPNQRSSHMIPIPRGAGVALLAGVVTGVAVMTRGADPALWGTLAAASMLGIVGLVEDVRGLSVETRLALQLAIGGGAAVWILSTETSLSGGVYMGSVVLGCVWIAGFTNAFNFMDGINGISALTALFGGVWYAAVSSSVADSGNGMRLLGVSVAAAALAFLPWNLPRTLVFLGDVGSYMLGGLLACCSVWALAIGVRWPLAFAPAMVYLADTGWASLTRVLHGRSWKEAHRDHVYQQLADNGWSHARTSQTCVASIALSCGLALVGTVLVDGWRGDLLGFVLALVVCSGYLLLPWGVSRMHMREAGGRG